MATNYVWVHSLFKNVSVCLCTSLCDFFLNLRELNSRCLNENPIHYHLSHSGLSIWVIILPNTRGNSYFVCENFSGPKLFLGLLSFSKCVSVHVTLWKKMKNLRELNSRCLNEKPIQYHLSHSGLSIPLSQIQNKLAQSYKNWYICAETYEGLFIYLVI